METVYIVIDAEGIENCKYAADKVYCICDNYEDAEEIANNYEGDDKNLVVCPTKCIVSGNIFDKHPLYYVYDVNKFDVNLAGDFADNIYGICANFEDAFRIKHSLINASNENHKEFEDCNFAII